VRSIKKGAIFGVNEYVTKSKIAVCLYQACYRTLLDQENNGTWNDSVEGTCYEILILGKARELYLFRDLRTQLDHAIDDAAKFIREIGSTSNYGEPQHLWIEEVSYTTPLVTEAYRLAALQAITVRTGSFVGRSLHEYTCCIP
jgi:hypothetical protein